MATYVLVVEPRASARAAAQRKRRDQRARERLRAAELVIPDDEVPTPPTIVEA